VRVWLNWTIPASLPARAEIETKSAETTMAEATSGLQRRLMCAVAVSMPPPSKGVQTA
jgi:hypothetical protein